MVLIFLLPWFALPFGLGANSSDLGWKKVSKNGMEVRWRFLDDKVELEMQAPTSGWLALGFNTKPGLSGTNLVMAAVLQGKTVASDRYVLKPGDHREISELGGKSLLSGLKGREEGGYTSVRFLIPAHSRDKWHHELVAGKKIYLLLAYSREDDFQHHSMMRAELVIEL